MKLNSLLLLFVLGVTQLAQAADLTADRIKSYLHIDPVYYTDGHFKGQAIDQAVKRPVRFIPELETESSYFVSHFYSQGQFWIAEIPKAGVKNVVFQLALFKGPLFFKLAHSQFRFLMSKPVKLYREKDGVVKVTRTGDLIFTVQAALPAGKEYNAVEAFRGTYKMTSRLTNTYDRAKLEEVNTGDIVTQYLMKNMSSDQKNLLLLNSVRYSDENLYEKDYIATTENCISVTFDILDDSLALNYSRVVLTLKNTLLNGRSPNEKMVLKELRKRKLIDDRSRLENYR